MARWSKKDIAAFEKALNDRAARMGLVKMSPALEGKTVQVWCMFRDHAEGEAFRVIRVQPAQRAPYLILDIERGGKVESHVSGWSTETMVKVMP